MNASLHRSPSPAIGRSRRLRRRMSAAGCVGVLAIVAAGHGATASGAVWSPPAKISPDLTNINRQAVRVDDLSAGNALTAAVWSTIPDVHWTESLTTGSHLHVSMRQDGAAWAPPIKLTPEGESAQPRAIKSFIDAMNQTIVIWGANRGLHDPIGLRYAVRAPNGTWGPSLIVPGTDGKTHINDVAALPSGELLALWSRDGDGHFISEWRHGAWQSPVAPPWNGSNPSRPYLSVSQSGDSAVSWSSSPQYQLMASTRSAAGEWETPFAVPGARTVHGRAVATRDGSVAAAWNDYRRWDIFGSRRDPGGTWSPAQIIGHGNIDDMAATADGSVSAVWGTVDSGGVELRGSFSPLGLGGAHLPAGGSTWETGQSFLPSGTTAGSLIPVAFTAGPSGPVVPWIGRNAVSGTNLGLTHITRSPGSRWAHTVAHDRLGLPGESAKVALHRNGAMTMIWLVEDFGVGLEFKDYVAATTTAPIPPTDPLPPPSSVLPTPALSPPTGGEAATSTFSMSLRMNTPKRVRLRAALKGLRVRCITSKSARCSVSVALDRDTAPRLRYKRPARGKVRVIARVHATAKAKSSKVVPVRFSSTVRKRLQRALAPSKKGRKAAPVRLIVRVRAVPAADRSLSLEAKTLVRIVK